MRYITVFFIALSIVILLSGCNNDGDRESTQIPSLIQDHKFGLHSFGKYYRYKKFEDVGTYEMGPIAVTIEMAEVVKGRSTVEFRTEDHNKLMEMVNVQIKFELNRELRDGFTFNNEHLQLSTNTGELIQQPDEFMSSIIHMSVLETNQKYGNESNLRQFTFLLKDSTVEEIEKATLKIDSPIDHNGQILGEGLEVEIDFSNSEDTTL
ncbi:hypothetical protein [Oceanobacillus manasiensis]|uniref:hypothetical protein n=1 Tax=Oceanobacillus manasiensis TaxID=586413 RepID=UPI0005A8A263|nr:hypothetical protein [Oceanobacillus manasiensis]